MLSRWTRAILAIAWLTLALPAAGAAALSAGDGAHGRDALRAAAAGDWVQTGRLADSMSRPLAGKVIRWQQYTAGNDSAGFEEIAAFIERNPHWPRQSILRQRAEEAMTPSLPARRTIEWFDRNPPVSTAGRVAYAKALLVVGDSTRAREAARDAWIRGSFSASAERAFLATFGSLLDASDHRQRLDRLLWRGRTAEAKRVMSRVDAGTRAVAAARMGLRARAAGVDSLVARVPAHLLDDPGLVYERVRWRRKKGLDDGAISLLLLHSGDIVEPERWSTERQVLARRALALGRTQDAYRIASGHGVTSGSKFGEAEWLPGWIALRFLRDPASAGRHFERVYAGVTTPISRARGAYWAGRAAEEAGNRGAAERWYARAAGHPATFYGQLAAGRLNPQGAVTLPPDPLAPAEMRRAFDSHELTAAVRLLADLGKRDTAGIFLVALSAVNEAPAWKALAASLGYELGRPDLAVTAAKRANRNGGLLASAGYPSIAVPALASMPREVEQPLVLAMIRQESAYRTDAVSSAGARGLMQLMPGTAREVAARLGLPYSKRRLVTDQAYNLMLGQRYISSMLARFDGSYVLGLAAYNAGPYNVQKWQQAMGAPRAEVEGVIDWIERIPFSETRNYVQRILEHLQVYRAKANGGTVVPALLRRDLLR